MVDPFSLQAVIVLFTVLQLASLLLWACRNVPSKRAGVAASVLAFVSSLMLIPVSFLEHSKSLRPSMLLNAYLLCTFVLDAAILRTLWLEPFDLVICGLFTASFGIKCALVFLEAVEKRRYFASEYTEISPEESSGLYSQSLLWWLNHIMVVGARQILGPTDLYPIAKDMLSERLSSSFWEVWSKRRIPVGSGGLFI